MRRTPRPLISDDDEADARRFARLVAEELFQMLARGDTLASVDVSPRPGKGKIEWRDEEKENGFSDPISSESSGESLWSETQAKEIVGSIRRKKKPGK